MIETLRADIYRAGLNGLNAERLIKSIFSYWKSFSVQLCIYKNLIFLNSHKNRILTCNDLWDLYPFLKTADRCSKSSVSCVLLTVFFFLSFPAHSFFSFNILYFLISTLFKQPHTETIVWPHRYWSSGSLGQYYSPYQDNSFSSSTKKPSVSYLSFVIIYIFQKS